MQKKRALRLWSSELKPRNFKEATVAPASYLPWQWLGIAELEDGYLTGTINLKTGTIVPGQRFINSQDQDPVQRSKQTNTVRHFLEESMYPHVSVTHEEENIIVRWREIAYAFSPDIDLYMAKVIFSPNGEVIFEEFKERWENEEKDEG